MRFDVENELSSAQAFTAGSTLSTNTYQKQSAAQDISIGRRMALMLIVTTAASNTSAVLDLVQADNTALTTNLEVLGTITLLEAAMTVGAVFEIPCPQGTIDQLHLGFRCVQTGGAQTVSFDAYLVPQDEIPKYKSFPKVVNAEV